MKPHRHAVILGRGLQAVATLRRGYTRMTFEVNGNTYVSAWRGTDSQCYDNTYGILKTFFKSFFQAFALKD